jgi:enoyl-CoA hydratase
MDFNYLELIQKDDIATLWLNNAKKANCLNETLWFELGKAIQFIEQKTSNKVIILRSKGKHFSSGIDFNFLKSIKEKCSIIEEQDRQAYLHDYILEMQDSFNQFEATKLPVIALIHGACIGGAIDLITACDIRYCTVRTAFSIMETKLGIVADMGTLQRMRFILSESNLRKLAFTSEIFKGYKAKKLGLVSHCFLSQRAMERHAYRLAHQLTKLPQDALQGTKQVLNYSRNTSIEQGLAFVAKHNAKALLSFKLPL